jgi:hypothetical protein
MAELIKCDLNLYSNSVLMKVFGVSKGTIYKWKKAHSIPFKYDYIQTAMNLIAGMYCVDIERVNVKDKQVDIISCKLRELIVK